MQKIHKCVYKKDQFDYCIYFIIRNYDLIRFQSIPPKELLIANLLGDIRATFENNVKAYESGIKDHITSRLSSYYGYIILFEAKEFDDRVEWLVDITVDPSLGKTPMEKRIYDTELTN